MKGRWFRKYESTMDDPKVQLLSDWHYRAWDTLLCFASKCGGEFTDAMATLCFVLRKPEGKVRDTMQVLLSAGLMEKTETGYKPHNWDVFQYTSEQKQQWRHRDKREELGLPRNRWVNPKVRAEVFERDGNVCQHCGTPENLTIDHIVSEIHGGSNEPENMQTLCRACNARKREFPDEIAKQSATHKATHKAHISIDTETEQIQSRAEQKDSRALARTRFQEFWLVCPKKVGKGKAEKLFGKACETTSPDLLIASMGSFGASQAGKDPEFIAHPATWLSHRRWEDEGVSAAPASAEIISIRNAFQSPEELEGQRLMMEKFHGKASN